MIGADTIRAESAPPQMSSTRVHGVRRCVNGFRSALNGRWIPLRAELMGVFGLEPVHGKFPGVRARLDRKRGNGIPLVLAKTYTFGSC